MPANLNELVKALEPPTITIGRHTWVGRILSYEEFAPFRDGLLRLADDAKEPLSPAEQLTFVESYLRAVFPPRWAMVWRGDPVRTLMRSPPVVLHEVLKDFLACQLRATTTRMPGATSPTPTPPSRP